MKTNDISISIYRKWKKMRRKTLKMLFVLVSTLVIIVSSYCCVGYAEENATGRIVVQFLPRQFYTEIRICNPQCGKECNVCNPYHTIKRIGSDRSQFGYEVGRNNLFLLPPLKSGGQKLGLFLRDRVDDISAEISIYVAANEVKIYTVELIQIQRAGSGQVNEAAFSNKRFRTMEGLKEWAFDNGYTLHE
ncbi:hypothetical protein ACFL38_00120 [Candidatus Omnitrophota bacterium]